VDLVERRLGPRALLACIRCGGVWLDVVACREIVERAPATASLLFLADQSTAAATVQPGERTAACPVCRAPMQRTPVDGVEASIDTCYHGTWFDARELRLVAEALKRASEYRPPPVIPNTPGRSYGDQFDRDHGEIFGDVAECSLRFLSSLFDSDR
jgi:Zn-finger nucleic acid-binding protein